MSQANWSPVTAFSRSTPGSTPPGEGHAALLPGGHLDPVGVDQLPVEEQLQRHGDRFRAEILQPGEGLEPVGLRLSLRPHAEGHDAHVGRLRRPMGTNTGSRLPSAKPATGANLPSLKIYSLAGRASATRTSLMSSALRPGLASPEATFRASSSEVGRCVGWIASRRVAQLPAVVGETICSTRAASAKADQHRHVAGAHLVDQLADPPLRLVQPGGLHVGGLHAGRVVDQEDETVAGQVP